MQTAQDLDRNVKGASLTWSDSRYFRYDSLGGGVVYMLSSTYLSVKGIIYIELKYPYLSLRNSSRSHPPLQLTIVYNIFFL